MSHHRLFTTTIAAGEIYSEPITLNASPDYSQNVTLAGLSVDTINGNRVHFEVDIGDGTFRPQYSEGEELVYKVDDDQAICLNPNQFQAWKRVRIYFTQGNNPQTQDAERTIYVATRST